MSNKSAHALQSRTNGRNGMVPHFAKLTSVKPESPAIHTYGIEFLDPDIGSAYRFLPGQFNMLYMPGIGEVAISISSDPTKPEALLHTIRIAGNVTQAIDRLRVEGTLGVRGPYGSSWPVERAEGKDIIFVGGGIGLAPLRPAIYHVIQDRKRYGKVTILIGARNSGELLFIDEYDAWSQYDIEVIPTVDRGDESWHGRVGVVPMLFYSLRPDARRTIVFTCGPEIMMRFVVYEALARRIPEASIYVSLERNMKCGIGLCGHCQYGPTFLCKEGPVLSYDKVAPFFSVEDFLMSDGKKPKLAVYKFSSCDGCQLSLLDCEDELLEIADAIEIAYFMEARRRTLSGPYDVTLVEGSVTTEEEIEHIKEVREQSRLLVSIGACATAGGIQALRNWVDVQDFVRTVYATPEYIHTLDESRPISDFVNVDFELQGCPISKEQLLELVTSLLIGRLPRVPSYSVCLECKRRGTVCITVASGEPCLGPATQAGCGALCPAYNRGCYGCFGPFESGNPIALGEQFIELGLSPLEVSRAFRGFNGYAEMFRDASNHFEKRPENG